MTGLRKTTTTIALAVLGLAVAAFTSGCASLTDAGHVAYGVKQTAQGGCDFSAADGKEFASRSISMVSTKAGCQMEVNEGASSAFQGQAIAEKGLSVLPSFAPLVLPPGPANAVPQVPQLPPVPAGKSL